MNFRLRWVRCALFLAGATAAGAADFSIENVERDLRPRYPQLARVSDALPPSVVASENVTYATVAGITLQLDLYRPAAAGPHPAVLLVHGGGWETGSRQMERPFAKQLAALGYVAVPVSYRLGPPGRFPAALHDLKSAIRWLRAHAAAQGIDPRRVGVIGGSAGGQLAALLGATNGIVAFEGTIGERAGLGAVQAVVDIDGLVDFTDPELLAQQSAQPSAPTRFLGGSFAERGDVWREASPLMHVSATSAPTLFVNSTSATPLLPGRPAMRDRLRAVGVDAALTVIPETPHPFWLFHPWFDAVLRATDEFLARHLKAAEPPSTRPSAGAIQFPADNPNKRE